MWGWDGGEGFVSARLLTLLPAAVPFPKERKEPTMSVGGDTTGTRTPV